MKIDVDLNTLNIEELETVIKLAKKQKELKEIAEEDEIVEEKPISIGKKHKVKIIRGKKGIIDDRNTS